VIKLKTAKAQGITDADHIFDNQVARIFAKRCATDWVQHGDQSSALSMKIDLAGVSAILKISARANFDLSFLFRGPVQKSLGHPMCVLGKSGHLASRPVCRL